MTRLTAGQLISDARLLGHRTVTGVTPHPHSPGVVVITYRDDLAPSYPTTPLELPADYAMQLADDQAPTTHRKDQP